MPRVRTTHPPAVLQASLLLMSSNVEGSAHHTGNQLDQIFFLVLGGALRRPPYCLVWVPGYPLGSLSDLFCCGSDV